MSDPLYLARAFVQTLGPLHRRARLVLGAEADMGVHGSIRDHYGLRPERDLPLPVDYIVAATGG
jgi:hypothetical protein